MKQIVLPLAAAPLTGSAALQALPASVRARLTRQMAGRCSAIYIAVRGADDYWVWSGKGKRPAWVTDYLNAGGTQAQLEAQL